MFPKSNLPLICRVGVLAIATAASSFAGASEILYGGGATFPAQPYIGTSVLLSSTNDFNARGTPHGPIAPAPGSVFGRYYQLTGNPISYCQTGSGFGKGVLNAANPASGFCVSPPAGFGSVVATPDYVATDAPYSTADYNAFNGSSLFSTRDGITQIPTIAGAIGLPHHTVSGGLVDKYNLTTAAVCQIFSGKISTWAQVTALLGVNSGSTGTIKIVYRTDNSGTSFAFTSYLAAKCNGTANVPSGFVFAPNPSFDSAVPGGVSGTYGTRAIGASGNSGLVAVTRMTTDAQGYADIGDVIAQAAEYDFVNGFDPAQFGAAGPIAIDPSGTAGGYSNLLAGKVLDGATINSAPGPQSTTVKNCLRLVNPGATIPNVYPIAAITYLAGYYAGNGSASHVQAIKNLYGLYFSTMRLALPVGFAYLDGNSVFRTQMQSSIANCVK